MSSLDDCLEEVGALFFGGSGVITRLGGSSGMSGSVFARVESRGAVWCLRGWSPGLSPDRLRFVHRILLQSRAEGFDGVPALAETYDGDTAVEIGGRIFDVQEWLSGEPLSGRRAWGISVPNVALKVEPAKLSALARATAAFHQSTEALRPDHQSETLTLRERLETHAARAVTEVGPLYEVVRATSDGEEHGISSRWLQLLPEAIKSAEDTLKRYPSGALATSTLCHGDLWAPHVNFSGPDFVGWTDFESLHFGTAATDLAQLILHFNGWGSRETVLRAYGEVRALAPEEEAILPAEAVADLAFEGVWALERLYGGGQALSTDEKTAHRTNLRVLLESLEEILEDPAKASASL